MSSSAGVFSYNVDQFAIKTERGKESEFDRKLKFCWEEKMVNNCFRYNLDDVETKCVPGKYKFIAQLNIQRAVQKRKSEFISSVNMPFKSESFHFGKVDPKEILFELLPMHWDQDVSCMSSKHMLIINVSPLEYCNSLLIPDIDKCYPQVLNFNSLRLAIETVLISHDLMLKVGMNSLGGYASVNHLHFHIYYLKEPLYLQYAPVKQIIGDCHEILNFPSEGFAFQLLKENDILSVVGSIMKLITYFQQEEIAHNIFITRGKSFSYTFSGEEDIFDAIRIFIWARKSSFGSKCYLEFNPALCELAGHLIIKNRTSFEDITEENVASILKDTCHDTFIKVQENIVKLYS